MCYWSTGDIVIIIIIIVCYFIDALCDDHVRKFVRLSVLIIQISVK